MKVVLDAGALVAIDKHDRRVGAMLRVLQEQGIPVWTSAAVVAQVWRHGARQTRLAKVLAGIGVLALGPTDGRRAGELQDLARTDDVVDAHVALLLDDGDRVLTSDPHDIAHLLEVRGVEAVIVQT